ncbi:hypothetical protein [Microcoleus sp. D3_18a_C4]
MYRTYAAYFREPLVTAVLEEVRQELGLETKKHTAKKFDDSGL